MPQVFMKILDPSNVANWYIIEVQGDLKTKTEGISLNGHLVGDLLFTNKGVPVIIIGHHVMYGKVVELEKPIAVLTRDHEACSRDFIDNQSDISSESPEDAVHHIVRAIVKKKIIFKTRPKPIIANVPKRV